jgi:hypothetical protein
MHACAGGGVRMGHGSTFDRDTKQEVTIGSLITLQTSNRYEDGEAPAFLHAEGTMNTKVGKVRSLCRALMFQVQRRCHDVVATILVDEIRVHSRHSWLPVEPARVR